MRVLFTTLPFKAHAYPRVPLAWALRAAGHDVRFASNPDLVDEIARTGLPVTPVGDPLAPAEMMAGIREREAAAREADDDPPDPGVLMRMDQDPAELTYDQMHGLFTVMTTLVFRNLSPDRTIEDLVALSREWRPDLVVWDPLGFAGAIAAEAVGAAHSRLMYGLDLVGRMRQGYLDRVRQLPPELREDPLQEWLAPVLGRYGARFDEDVVTGQWTVDPGPAWMRLPVDHHYVTVRPVSYNGRATVPHWLRDPPPRRRICLTLGLSHREVLGGNRLDIGELLRGVAGLDVEVVATLDADQLATVAQVPPNVRAVGFAPLNELLPSCAAVIHQGGTGTTQTALAHGVPQVLLPGDLWDTRLKADQLAGSGAVVVVPDAERLTADELRAALVRVLDDPACAAAADRLRTDLLAAPAPSQVVPVLELLTAAHRVRPFG